MIPSYKFGKPVEFISGFNINSGKIINGNNIINDSIPLGIPENGKVSIFVENDQLKYKTPEREVTIENQKTLSLTISQANLWFKFGNNTLNSGTFGDNTLISVTDPVFNTDKPTDWQYSSYDVSSPENILEIDLKTKNVDFLGDFTIDFYIKMSGGSSKIPLYATNIFTLSFDQNTDNFEINNVVFPTSYNVDVNNWLKITHTYENSTGIHRLYDNTGTEIDNINLSLSGGDNINYFYIGGDENENNFVGLLTSFKVYTTLLGTDDRNALVNEDEYSRDIQPLSELSETAAYDVRERNVILSDKLGKPGDILKDDFIYYSTTNPGDTNVLITNLEGQNYLPPVLTNFYYELKLIVRNTKTGFTNKYTITVNGRVGFFNEDLQITSIDYDKKENSPQTINWEPFISSNASGEIELYAQNTDPNHKLVWYGIVKINAIRPNMKPFSGTLIGELDATGFPRQNDSLVLLPFEGENGIDIYQNLTSVASNESVATVFNPYPVTPVIRSSVLPKLQAIYLDGNYDISISIRYRGVPAFGPKGYALRWIPYDEMEMDYNTTTVEVFHENIGETYTVNSVSHNVTVQVGDFLYNSPTFNRDITPNYYVIFVAESTGSMAPSNSFIYDVTFSRN